MAIDPNIPLQTQSFDMLGMLGRGSELAQFYTKQKTDGELNRIYNESQGDLNKMLQIGQQSKLARFVVPQIQSQISAQAKAAIDQQQSLANIGKTQSEAYKNNQQGGGYALDNSGKKLGAIQGAIQQAAITGDKTQALLALSGAQRSGLMSPEDFEYQSKIINAMTPDELKQYASGIVFSNAKDSSGILFQTANNAADNAQSDKNNIRSTNASIYSTDVGAQTAANKLEQDQQQFQKNFEYKAQQDEIKNGQGEVKELGGKSYIVYKNGDARPLVDQNGQHITKDIKSPLEIKKETERLGKMEAVLQQAEGLISNSTHSGLGNIADGVSGFFGYSNKGADNLAALKSLQGALVMMMPRMEGPQSDKDVQLYREMAGRLGEPIPESQRMEAIKIIRDLNAKYADIQGIQQNKQGVPYANASQQNIQLNQNDVNNILGNFGN